MKPDTITTALEALRFMAGYDEDNWGEDAHAAIADLTTQAEPQGVQWTPVAYVINDHLMELHADELAVTIGQDDTALATFAWPEEGRFAVCERLTPASPAPEVDVCEICGGGRLLELRVSIDQKLLVDCVCQQSMGNLAKEIFTAGYKRALADARPAPEGVTQPNTDELLPCPFCGGDGKISIDYVLGPDEPLYTAMCEKLLTWHDKRFTKGYEGRSRCGGLMSGAFNTREEAVAAWNQRTPTMPATLPSLDELSPVQLRRLSNFYDQLIDDDTQVCSECEGDGELEDNSHISPPVDGDWPMITCWKCSGTGVEPQPAPEGVTPDVLAAMKYVYSNYMLSSSDEPLGDRNEYVDNMLVIGNYLDRVGAWEQRPPASQG